LSARNLPGAIRQAVHGSIPPGSQPVELEVERAAGGARINVPDLDLWAIVRIGPGTINSIDVCVFGCGKKKRNEWNN